MPIESTRLWTDSGLDPDIVERIASRGNDVPITAMTPVQTRMLDAPPESHIFAVSPTGSGKTYAFLAPILRDMGSGTVSGALLLSPTNPLRMQHITTARAVAPPIASVVETSGASPSATVRRVSDSPNPSLIVSTPKKWLDLAESSDRETAEKARLYAHDRVSVIVLDEVDEFVRNPSFRREVERIVALSPNARVWSLTATRSQESVDFARRIAGNAHRDLLDIDVTDTGAGTGTATKSSITHTVATVPDDRVMPALAALLAAELDVGRKVMVFFATAMMAQFAHDLCRAWKLPDVYVLQSKMNRSAAAKAEKAFRACKKCALFASNVMARGIDVSDVDVVIQVGVSAPEEYVQRVGRSGRAGRAGRGILLVAQSESSAMVDAIVRVRGVRFERVDAPTPKPERSDVGTVRGSDRAFRATLGAYKTYGRTLGLTMRDSVRLLKAVFTGAGQSVPTLTASTARKLGVETGDGLEIVGAESHARHRHPVRGGATRSSGTDRSNSVLAMVAMAWIVCSVAAFSA